MGKNTGKHLVRLKPDDNISIIVFPIFPMTTNEAILQMSPAIFLQIFRLAKAVHVWA